MNGVQDVYEDIWETTEGAKGGLADKVRIKSFSVYRMDRLCGGAHQLSGSHAQLCGWDYI